VSDSSSNVLAVDGELISFSIIATLLRGVAGNTFCTYFGDVFELLLSFDFLPGVDVKLSLSDSLLGINFGLLLSSDFSASSSGDVGFQLTWPKVPC
jgi:hypothetical protein